jgi:hypothetical protein
MVGSDEDLARSRRPGAENQGWSSTGRVLSGWTIRRSVDAVCGLHHTQGDENVGFLVWPQNQGRRVSRFGSQNRQLRFGDLGFKITTTVSWFGSQNQAGNGLSVVPQNRREDDDAGHASRSSGLLHLEVSWARISQFASKLVEERRRAVHMASSRRTHEDEAEDGRANATGCIGLFYPYFTVFVV